jgi:hypothetical protein
MMTKAIVRLAVIGVLAAALAGCGGSDSGGYVITPPAPPGTPPPSAVTAVVGPAGGTVTGPDGVQVIVPAGAFSTGTGGPSLRGVGSTTVEVSAYPGTRRTRSPSRLRATAPGRTAQRGGDLPTFIATVALRPATP